MSAFVYVHQELMFHHHVISRRHREHYKIIAAKSPPKARKKNFTFKTREHFHENNPNVE